jgi:radical SAM protein with 4Fe4S-binding SPASM domain
VHSIRPGPAVLHLEFMPRGEQGGYDYVGISLDGIGPTHDRFRRRDGAFDASLRGIRLCIKHGIKVGLRFTLTQDNFHELPAVLDLMDREGADKFYLSHLNYAGRGNKHRADDAHFDMTQSAMDLLFDATWSSVERGDGKEFVTGNNDADGVYFLMWAAERFHERLEHLRAKLEQWGGSSSGVNVANIDNLGIVHPDTFWWHYTLGNVRDRPFSAIWPDLSDPIMAGLKAAPRAIEGRCAACQYFAVCGGNTRVSLRADDLDTRPADPAWPERRENGLPHDVVSKGHSAEGAGRGRGAALGDRGRVRDRENRAGLDHNETRSWHGWHRPVSLVMLAFALLMVIRHKAETLTSPQKRPPTHRRNPWCDGHSRKSVALPGV